MREVGAQRLGQRLWVWRGKRTTKSLKGPAVCGQLDGGCSWDAMDAVDAVDAVDVHFQCSEVGKDHETGGGWGEDGRMEG